MMEYFLEFMRDMNLIIKRELLDYFRRKDNYIGSRFFKCSNGSWKSNIIF